MENKNTLLEKIASLKIKQEKLTSLLENFDKICDEKKKDCYDKVEKELKTFLEKAPKIVKPIVHKFRTALLEKDGVLYLNGKKFPSVSYNETNSVTVFKNAQRVFETTVRTICANISTLRLSEHTTMEILRQLCESYNTIFDFYENKNVLFQAQWNDEYQMLCAERATANEKLSDNKKQIDDLENKLRARAETTEKMKDKMQFHHSDIPEDSFVSEITIPLGYITDDNEKIESICEWNPTKNNILRIVVPQGMEKDDCLSSFLKNTVLKFYNSYPIGAFRLLISDEYQFVELDNLFDDILGKVNSDDASKIDCKLFLKTEENATGIHKNNKKVISEYCKVIEGRRPYKSVLEFNRENPDIFVPITLVLINGYRPDSEIFDATSKSCIENGKKAGVYFIFTEYQSNTKRGITLENLEPHSLYLQKSNEGALTFKEGNSIYTACQIKSDCDLSEYSKIILRRLKNAKNIVQFEKIVSEHQRDTESDFSKVLTIPIGKTTYGTHEVLALNSKNSSAHCMIAGKTGTGKSSLLQSIVLGSAYHYTPDELEIYLIDLKDGTAFYKEDRDYSKLKHVKMMSTNCRKQDVVEFIHHIKETKLKMSHAAGSIVEYNRNRPKEELMKRTLIIIDEYTSIKDSDYKWDLKTIAEKGRAFGVSLVLSSLKYDSNFDEIRGNTGHFYDFLNGEKDCYLIKGDNADYSFLSILQGNCLKKGDGSKEISKFRVAYTCHQNEMIENINKRHEAKAYKKPIHIGSESIKKEKLVPLSKPQIGLQSSNKKIQYDCLIGKNILGYDSFFRLGESTILVGDGVRARNIEYSILKTFCLDSTDFSKIYYLNLNKDPLQRDSQMEEFSNYISNVAEVITKPVFIVETLQKLYVEYKKRKQQASWFANGYIDSVSFEPIVVVLHNFGNKEQLLTAKEQPQGVEKDEKVQLKEDIDARIEKEIEKRRNEIEKKQKDEYGFESESESKSIDDIIMLLVEEAHKYNICFVTHIATYEKNSLGLKLLNSSKGVIVIPSADIKNSAQSRSLLIDVTNEKNKRLKELIKDEAEMSTELLNRIYYLKNTVDFEQINPFEYE